MGSILKVKVQIFFAYIFKFVFSCIKITANYKSKLDFQSHVYGDVVQHSEMPKVIWAYWDGDGIPLVVQCCFDSWVKYCPDYKIIIVNNKNLTEFVKEIPPEVWNLSVHKRSDWLRLELLNLYGGIWLDAGILLTQSLDWIVDKQRETKADFVGFYLKGFTSNDKFPVVENWFMAAPAGSVFIRDVRNEFLNEVIRKDVDSYIAKLKRENIFEDVCQKIDSPDYLTMHIAVQAVMQSPNANFQLQLVAAEDSAFLWQSKSKWHRDLFKFNLFFKRVDSNVTPMLKLRGPDRRRLDLYLKDRLFVRDSFADRYFINK